MANKIPLAVADFQTQLSAALAAGGTSFSMTSATDDDGNALPAGKYCFTIDIGKSTKEYLMGQLNGTAVTSVVRVSRQGVETSGAQYKHRIGAPIVVTDFATIQRVADILRGQIELDGSSPLAYDAEPTLSAREALATVGYVNDTASGDANLSFDKQTTTGTAGEDISQGELIYFNTADQEWYLADATDGNKSIGVQLGIALGAGSDGVAIVNGVQISGVYTSVDLTPGSDYFAGDTAGSISATTGTNTRNLGFALSATKLLLNNLGSNDPQGPGSYVPTGTVLPYAGSTAPSSYLLCDGSAVTRTTYADLFALIGETYGSGNGTTTFNVPDLRGSIPFGAGTKTRSYSTTMTPAMVSVANDSFDVGSSRKYGNAKPITVTLPVREGFGRYVYPDFSSVDGSGWIVYDGNSAAFVPNVDDKVFLCQPNSVNFTTGFYYVKEVSGNSFRVSTTRGGSVAGSGNSGSVCWMRVDDAKTEGESGAVTWNDSGDYFGLGTNSMPVVGDRIAVTYVSSASPDTLGVYTVTQIDYLGGFRTTAAGGDTGTVMWVNLGQGAATTQPYVTGTYYTVYYDTTDIRLALTEADAIQGNYISVDYAGDVDTTFAFSDALSTFTLGSVGGHELNKLSVAEMPAHTHTGGGVGSSLNGGGSSPSPTGDTGSTGGSQSHSLLPPYVTLNYIIKY